MSKSKKSAIIICVIVVILGAAVAIFASLNAGDVAYKKELEMSAIYEIKQGDTIAQVTMDDMLALSPVTVDAVLDTSTTDPTDVQFSGVELKKVLESKGIDFSGADSVEVRSLDGYTSAITADEIMMDDNVYICIAQGEESLKTKSEGGMGPYLMIIKSSSYSQRWCKFVQEIVAL